MGSQRVQHDLLTEKQPPQSMFWVACWAILYKYLVKVWGYSYYSWFTNEKFKTQTFSLIQGHTAGFKPSLLDPNWCMSGSICARVYICGTLFVHTCMHVCECVCVCAYAIHMCSVKARIQVRICLMQRMHSHTIVSKFKKRIVTDISVWL